MYEDIVKAHREQLPPEALVLDTKRCRSQGIMSEALILKHVHMFVAYGLWLQRATQTWETSLRERDGLQKGKSKSPFQVIPQYTLRVRFMDFGPEQICELIQRMIVLPEVQALFSYELIPSLDTRNLVDIVKTQHQIQGLQTTLQQPTLVLTANVESKYREQLSKQQSKLAELQDTLRKRKRQSSNDDDHRQRPYKQQKTTDDKWKTIPRAAWLHMIDIVGKTLFKVPNNIRKKWTGTVSTNGVVAHWHVRPIELESTTKTNNNTKKAPGLRTAPRAIHRLEAKHYGVHHVNSIFPIAAMNVIAVDPGHVDLISAIRSHIEYDEPLPVATGIETKKQRRRRLLAEKMFELKRSSFSLSNKEWQSNTGRLLQRHRLLGLAKALEMEATYAALSECSSRTGFSDAYMRHIQVRISTSDKMRTYMEIKMTRRWSFASYQPEQRAVKKLATSLLGGLQASNTLVVWGNGGFSPTSYGHAPAPNKKLQTQLSKYVPMVVASEYRSSITSACHHCEVVPHRSKASRRHTTMSCVACWVC